MGYLIICNGNDLRKYGSKNSSSACECDTKNNMDNIYTDGGLIKSTGQGGYGVYSPGLRIQIAKPCPYAEHKNNVLRLESKAILEAVTHVKKNHKTLDRIDIFSDSEHALTQLQLLQNGEKLLPSDDNGGLGERILKEINVNDWCTKVHMHKVKAHSGVKGNKIADSFAKAGAKEATRVDPRLLPKWAPDNRNDEEIYSSKSFSSYNKKIARVSHLPSPASSKVHSSYPATKRPSVSPSPFADGRNVDSANRSTKCTRRFP